MFTGCLACEQFSREGATPSLEILSCGVRGSVELLNTVAREGQDLMW